MGCEVRGVPATVGVSFLFTRGLLFFSVHLEDQAWAEATATTLVPAMLGGWRSGCISIVSIISYPAKAGFEKEEVKIQRTSTSNSQWSIWGYPSMSLSVSVCYPVSCLVSPVCCLMEHSTTQRDCISESRPEP